MATAVIMPRQGQSVESCLIGKWHKSKGDKIATGDILFTYETDKATFDEESKVDGILLDVFFEEGDDVECLVNVCVIGAEGESTEEFKPGRQASQGVAQVSNDGGEDGSDASAKPTSGDTAVTTGGTGADSLPKPDSAGTGTDNLPDSAEAGVDGLPKPDSAFISPRARRLAERTKADLRFAVPTGANGRIIERDVQAVLSQGYRGSFDVAHVSVISGGADAASSGIAGVASSAGVDRLHGTSARKLNTPDSEEVKLTNIRKFIAKAMHASLANAAQLTNHSSFDATDILAFRKKLKTIDGNEALAKITVTDIIIYAVSRVILNHKSINAHFQGDAMAVFNNAHIGVAVDTPRGLLVPTFFNANSLSLTEISAHAKMLFDKCKQGSIEPDFLKGASFTISNLGALGVEMFTPILNPPQTGLLGVCAIIERTRDGKPYPAMGLSLTYDHRAVDGADAARFSKDLAQYLENFSINLALEGI